MTRRSGTCVTTARMRCAHEAAQSHGPSVPFARMTRAASGSQRDTLTAITTVSEGGDAQVAFKTGKSCLFHADPASLDLFLPQVRPTCGTNFHPSRTPHTGPYRTHITFM